MVISHKYRFIFVKTPKTAGTSLEVFLSGVCGDDDVLTPIEPHVPPHRARNYQAGGFYNHMPAREIRDRLEPEVWNSYFKFCVERNPWDKTISHYYFLKGYLEQRNGSNEPLTLAKYFDRGMSCSSTDLYADVDGRLIVDRVLRYEQLAEDLKSIFSPLGISFSGELGVRAKSEYRSDRRHYREILDDSQRDLIANMFAREIALFGYRF